MRNLRIVQKDNQFHIVDRKGNTISEFDTEDEAVETLYAWREDEAESQMGFDAREDTPCLQPEDFMNYHS